MIARNTLNGFYHYDNTILDMITLPPQFNKQIMIDELIHMCGDLYPYIQQPNFLKRNIHNWFLRNYENFERMASAFYSEYNPIENYNRYEHWKDVPDLTVVTDVDKRTTTDTETDTTNDNVTTYDLSTQTTDDKTTTNNLKTETKNDNTEEQTSAFDSSSYQPKSKTLHGSEVDNTGTVVEDGESTQTTTGTLTDDGESTQRTTGSMLDTGNTTQKTNGNTEHDGRIHGNIGVTTNQQMINAELELRENDLYSIIRSKFEDEFIVRVY
ncbi:MAG: hypothetical protein J6S67_17435 [Methanobrevibacter sp.]|nr:hypothetical protein [Methanobrevibacter sp.]